MPVALEFPARRPTASPLGALRLRSSRTNWRSFSPGGERLRALYLGAVEAELAAMQPSARSLERAFGAEPAVVKLRNERAVLQARLNDVQRLARSSTDPAILNIRKEIRKSEAEERQLREEQEGPLRERLSQTSAASSTQSFTPPRSTFSGSETRAETLRENATQRPEKPLDSNHLLLEALRPSRQGFGNPNQGGRRGLLDRRNSLASREGFKAHIASHNALIETLVEALARARQHRNAQRVVVTRISEPQVRSTRNDAFATILMALLLGCVSGVLITIVAEWSNPRFRKLSDLRHWSCLPLIGRILRHIDPETAAHDDLAILCHQDPCSPPAESYKAARTVLEVLAASHGARVLVVSSPRPASGASAVAVNLAIVMAQAGRRTLLIDGDLLQPSLHRAFDLPCEPGFTEVLLGSGSLGELARPTGVANLHLLCAGARPHCPIDLIASVPLRAYLHNAQSDYDVVLLEASPLVEYTATSLLASAADGLVLVLRIGFSTRSDVQRARKPRLAAVRILGVLACQ